MQVMLEDWKFQLLLAAILITALILNKAVIKATNSLNEHSAKSYRCRFTKAILPPGASGEYDAGTVEVRAAKGFIQLPFTPYIGLSISDSFDGTNWYSGVIEAVHWDNVGEFFRCRVEPHQLDESDAVGGVLYYQRKSGWTFDPLCGETKQSFDKFLAEMHSE